MPHSVSFEETQDEALALQLRALGHPVRLSILRILAKRQSDCCCADVTQCLPLAQSTVSQHIKVLLDAGLIERKSRGTRNCYVLVTARFNEMQSAFGGLSALLLEPDPADAETAGAA